jgi:hypothetical protein
VCGGPPGNLPLTATLSLSHQIQKAKAKNNTHKNNTKNNSRATVPFATAEAAGIVCRAVSVDPELRAGHVRRELRAEGSTLVM